MLTYEFTAMNNDNRSRLDLELYSELKKTFEWLGVSSVNATGEPPSCRTNKLYAFLVLLNTQYGWRATEFYIFHDSTILVRKSQNTY